MATNFPNGVLIGTAAVITNTGSSQVAIRLEGDTKQVRLYDQQGTEFCQINAAEHVIRFYDQQGSEICQINEAGQMFLGRVGLTGRSGGLIIYNDAGNASISLRGQIGSNAMLEIGSTGSPGGLRLRNSRGVESLLLDGEKGDITLHNADCAEEFPVANGVDIEPATVVVIDDDGLLRPCSQPYDSRVIGIISGGGGENAGLTLGRGKWDNRCAPVALIGTVLCKVTAEYGPIKTGGLLTTSPTGGHAMQADGQARRQGTLIGKALRKLDTGKGLLPVLIMLR